MNLHELTERKGCGWARAVTECIHGHAYTPENTYRFKDGRRYCRTCNIERCREYRALG